MKRKVKRFQSFGRRVDGGQKRLERPITLLISRLESPFANTRKSETAIIMYRYSCFFPSLLVFGKWITKTTKCQLSKALVIYGNDLGWVSLQQKGRGVGVQQITFNKMNGGFHLDQILEKNTTF